MWFIKLKASVGMCEVFSSVCGCLWVGAHVCGCVWVCADVCGCVRVCVGVWNEFSEYLLETWVLTSANFNVYPIQIFYYTYLYLCFVHDSLQQQLNAAPFSFFCKNSPFWSSTSSIMEEGSASKHRASFFYKKCLQKLRKHGRLVLNEYILLH